MRVKAVKAVKADKASKANPSIPRPLDKLEARDSG
jgi:hypothetical protein